MKTAIFARHTFRLHDNPLLESYRPGSGSCVLFVIDTSRLSWLSGTATTTVPTLNVGARGSSLTATPPPQPARLSSPGKKSNGKGSVLSAGYDWGYHQFYLFLQCVHSHVKQLEAIGIPSMVLKGPMTAVVKEAANHFDDFVTDRVDDPAFFPMDVALEKSFPARRSATPAGYEKQPSASGGRFLCTHTLIDWHDGTHKYEAMSNAKFKVTFMEQHYPTLRDGSRVYTPSSSSSSSSSASSTPPRRRSSPHPLKSAFKCDIETEIKDLRTLFQQHHIEPIPLPSFSSAQPPAAAGVVLEGGGAAGRKKKRNSGAGQQQRQDEVEVEEEEVGGGTTCPITTSPTSVEDHAIQLLHRSTAVFHMDDPAWNKPHSASTLAYADVDLQCPLLNTSKLSPFIAVGAISCVKVLQHWAEQNPKLSTDPSSAGGQMLWRELFHASSTLPNFWATRAEANQLPAGATFWKEYPWRSCDSSDKKYLDWVQGNTGEADTDTAMRVLARDGWIHHLRRHVVADYLTRGHAEVDWMLGESWFRYTLLDHDACLNRGNWLWLSASKFSFKQAFRHYKHSDYPTRQTDAARKFHAKTKLADGKPATGGKAVVSKASSSTGGKEKASASASNLRTITAWTSSMRGGGVPSSTATKGIKEAFATAALQQSNSKTQTRPQCINVDDDEKEEEDDVVIVSSSSTTSGRGKGKGKGNKKSTPVTVSKGVSRTSSGGAGRKRTRE